MRKTVCSWALPMSLVCEILQRAERDPKSRTDRLFFQDSSMSWMPNYQGGSTTYKTFPIHLPVQDNAILYIRSTGVRPSRRMPLAMTCRAASYRAIRAFCNSGSLPTILR